MMRRAYLIGTVTLGLMLTAAAATPSYCRLLSSARSFQYYFHDLKQGAAALNPVERFVFSLVLANTKPVPLEDGSVAPERHT
ncbi:conserved exported hypothetical protein [Candidatus Sulfopaludibacter sp. SbA3]|nr:conserved exported hypothetical protein [Candidatus Sulfopaludibacter sp. SbA3]